MMPIDMNRTTIALTLAASRVTVTNSQAGTRLPMVADKASASGTMSDWAPSIPSPMTVRSHSMHSGSSCDVSADHGRHPACLG